MTDKANRIDLHYSALQGELEKTAELLKQGANPDAADNQGFTPLHFAAQSYEPKIAQLLVERGATVDAVNLVGNTPLGVAVFNSRGRGDVIEILLAAGADADRLNKAGVSPRMLSERIANYDIKRFFEG